jgi:hypothetical protein
MQARVHHSGNSCCRHGISGARRAGFSLQQRTGRSVQAKGTQSSEGYMVEPTTLRIQRLVGQGSFGEVFEVRCCASYVL